MSLDSGQPGNTYTGFHEGGAGVNSVYAIGFQAQITDVDGTAYAMDPLVTFCTELAEPISVSSYTFHLAPMQLAAAGRAGEAGTASSGIPAGGIGNLRAARAQWLFDHFAPSEILSDWTYISSQPLTQAFQLALWEVTHDSDLSLSSTSGDIYVGTQSNTTRNNAIKLAQSWLNQLSTANIDETYEAQNYHLWVLINESGNPDNGYGYQDILIASRIGSTNDGVIVEHIDLVPEPEVALLGGIGLLLVLRRRR
ncbi:hypothetical protein [Haloferula sargassicola]|uniref:hypothetical protein n=1 Tax=Haloferula sargassicola TaxID=490096 RepID=UPI00336542B5